MPGRIFISYCSDDISVANALATALRDAGLEPWYDRWEVKPGESFIQKMSEGLSQASYVLLVVSRDSMASRWVNEEWNAALEREDILLIPMVLHRDALPVMLRHRHWIDLSRDVAQGISEAVAFLRKETEPVETSRPNAYRGPIDKCEITRRTLRMIARKCMDETAFNDFLFDSGIEQSTISGNSLGERLVSLLHRVLSEDKLPKMLDWLLLERRHCVEAQMRNLAGEDSWSWS